MNRFFLVLMPLLISSTLLTTVSYADSCEESNVIFKSGQDYLKALSDFEGESEKIKENLTEEGFVDIRCRTFHSMGTHYAICCNGVEASRKLCNVIAAKMLKAIDLEASTVTDQPLAELYKKTCAI